MALGESFPTVLMAAREGAEWAWDRLYRELAGPLLGYLRSRGASEPEDLLGEVFLQLARNLGSFDGNETGFRSWAFMIAHHRVIDERRRKSRSRTAPADPEALEELGGLGDVEEEAMAGVATERVHRLLALLTEEQREVLVLRVLGGLTHEQVARVTGRTVGAVKALQRRGLAALRSELMEEGVPL